MGPGTGPSSNVVVVKLDLNGEAVWTEWINSMGSDSFDFASGISVDVEGSVFAAGSTGGLFPKNDNGGEHDPFIAKILPDHR